MSAPGPTITIVIPVYNEEAVLPQLIARLDALFAAHPEENWNVIFVNDGSRDASADLILSKATTAPAYRLIELSRNFGHQSALSAGLAAAAEADAVVTLDADLQDPPEIIPQLVKTWREGAEVVLAVRRSRRERGLRRVGFELFHRLFRLLADFEIERNTGTF